MGTHNYYMALKISLVVIFILSMVSLAQSQQGALIVISNQKGAPETLKYSELRSILKGEQQRWSNDAKIKIALMKTNTEAGKMTAKKIYSLSGDALDLFWLKQTIGFKAPPPANFNTVAELENFVSQNPGAIGIIDQPAQNNNVRTVIIDGKGRIIL